MREFTHRDVNWKMILIFSILVLFVSIKQDMDRNTPVTTKWELSFQHIGPIAFEQCDATDEYLYFSYMNSVSSVDVYDRQACYLYSLVFSDKQNGAIYLRCDQDKMYIKLRNDYVYVFQGKEELACMTEAEADSKGYTNAWFKAAESRLDVDNSQLYLLDEQGQCIAEIEKPQEINESFRLELSQKANTVMKVLCVFSFLCFCMYVIFKKT